MVGRGLLGLALVGFLAPDVCVAHYMWVVIDSDENDRVANVYFEEMPKPVDGSYLDHFLGKEKTWIRTLTRPNPEPLNAQEVKRAGNRGYNH